MIPAKSDAAAVSPLSARTVVGEFFRYLCRPRLLVPSGLRSSGAWTAWATMTALSIMVLLGVVLPLLTGWQNSFDLPAPDAFDKIPARWLAPIAVILAPFAEEIVFRGWQSGRPRALALLLLPLVLLAALFLLQLAGSGTALRIGLMVAGLVAIAVVWFRLRKRPAPQWFARAFPAIFYLVAVVFAAVHLTNYPSISALAVPMVLPQLWAALVLGFVRQRIGLPAAMLTHMTSNGAAILLASLSGG